MDSKDVKKHDSYSHYSMAASIEAWSDAGLEGHTYDKSKMGCILGVGVGGIGSLEKYHKAYLEGGPKKISPFLIPAMISNMGPGNIGIRFGLKGVNFTVTSACTSGVHAVGESARMIAYGLQDVMVTGGAESAVTPTGIGGFCALRALSTRNDAPEKASRPFDKDRDGFVMGEGSAVIILESYDSAVKRGAKIYAEITGYGVSCDAHHMTAPCEDGAGAVQCMNAAIQDAEITSSDIQYLNAHGTSTPLNDAAESAGIKQVFGQYAKDKLLVSSTKSMTGHLLGAAGALETAFCALAIKDQVAPPTINLENPGEGCDLDYVSTGARKTEIRYAMSNSFGFGGTNGSIILGRVK